MSYETFEHTSLDSLLDRIVPTRKDVDSYRISELRTGYFRGHNDSKWKLLPTCVRPEFIALYKKQILKNPHASEQSFMIAAEVQLLRRFMVELSDFGHESLFSVAPTPQDAHKTLTQESCKVFPDPKHLPLLSLAQHHSLPTRLLDVSKNPVVALFFAALNIDIHEGSDKQLCVWFFPNSFNEHSDIKVYHGLNSMSGNIKGQSGSFLYVQSQLRENIKKAESFHTFCSYNSTVPLEKLFCNTSARPEKHLLPQRYALEIIEFCDLHGVNAKTIFPSIEGIAMATFNYFKNNIANNELCFIQDGLGSK